MLKYLIFSMISFLLGVFAPNYKIKKPIFGTYEDLDEIVESVFKLFEDFKKAMKDLEIK